MRLWHQTNTSGQHRWHFLSARLVLWPKANTDKLKVIICDFILLKKENISTFFISVLKLLSNYPPSIWILLLTASQVWPAAVLARAWELTLAGRWLHKWFILKSAKGHHSSGSHTCQSEAMRCHYRKLNTDYTAIIFNTRRNEEDGQ